jgi:hypothetical protein
MRRASFEELTIGDTWNRRNASSFFDGKCKQALNWNHTKQLECNETNRIPFVKRQISLIVSRRYNQFPFQENSNGIQRFLRYGRIMYKEDAERQKRI